MTKKGILKYFFLLVCILYTSEVFSQLNLKIGYITNYINSDINNQIFDHYNETKPGLSSTFGKLHFLHGIQLGLRYKINMAAIEFTWENSSRSRMAIGEDPITGAYFDKNLFYKLSSYSIGLQNNFGAFGYGATIDSRTLRVQTNIGSSEDKREILSDTGLSSKFYLSFNVDSGDFMSMSIQPFIQIPWENVNLFNIENELIDNTMNMEDEFNENLIVFGLSIVFYNGAQ